MKLTFFVDRPIFVHLCYYLSQGFTEFRTFQLVSLTTGKVLNMEGPEQATLLNNAKLTQLFNTIPAPQPNPYL